MTPLCHQLIDIYNINYEGNVVRYNETTEEITKAILELDNIKVRHDNLKVTNVAV